MIFTITKEKLQESLEDIIDDIYKNKNSYILEGEGLILISYEEYISLNNIPPTN